MIAMRLHETTKEISKGLEKDEVPIPSIDADEVLVNVKATGLCGSDVHMIDGDTELPKYPITLGHEMAGIIEKVGREVDVWEEGDRVCGNFAFPCGECFYCETGQPSICPNKVRYGMEVDGAYAEFLKANSRQMIEVPDNVPLDHAAAATDAVATPFHAITKRSELKIGDSVAVFGLGGVGVHVVELAELQGAGKIIGVDVDDEICKRAREFGADEVINSQKEDPVEEIKNITGDGADLSFEVIGLQETQEQSVSCLRPGGRAVMIGLGAEPVRLPSVAVYVRRQYEVVGSYTFENEEIRKILELASEGKLDLSKTVTHKIRLEEVGQGLADLHEKKGNPIRMVAMQD